MYGIQRVTQIGNQCDVFILHQIAPVISGPFSLKIGDQGVLYTLLAKSKITKTIVQLLALVVP